MDAPQRQPLDALYEVAHDFKPKLEWDYAVKHLLRRGEVSVIFGPSNCGKSAMLGLMSTCIISGRPFLGCPTRRGIVVHVAAESPESVLERSVAYRGDLAGIDHAPYIVRKRAVDLSSADEVRTFIEELKALARRHGEPIVLVACDTLALSIGDVDENSPGPMTRIKEAAREIAEALFTHVSLVHHTGKDADRGSRGTSALQAAVDTEIALAPSKGGDFVRVTPVKQRTMCKIDPLAFRTEAFQLGVDEDGEPRSTVKAVPHDVSTSVPAEDLRYDRRTAVLTALHLFRVTRGAGPVTFKTRDIVDGLPAEVVAGVAEANRSNVVNRLLKELAEAPDRGLERVGSDWRLN